jgi:transcriptional regulator with XRE-family HTH domain
MGDKVRHILAANLKIYRKAHGISQMDLAERAGLSTSLIAAIETENKFPSSTSIMKLSDALGLEPYQLFIDPETDKKTEAYIGLGKLKKQIKSGVASVIESSFSEFLEK